MQIHETNLLKFTNLVYYIYVENRNSHYICMLNSEYKKVPLYRIRFFIIRSRQNGATVGTAPQNKFLGIFQLYPSATIIAYFSKMPLGNTVLWRIFQWRSWLQASHFMGR